MKTIFTITIFLLFFVFFAQAQDPHFSSNNEIYPYHSPGFIGTMENQMEFQTLYRNQWKNVGTAFQTYGLMGNAKVYKSTGSSLSVGGFVINQQAFSYQNTLVNLMVASNVKLSEGNILSVGLGAGTRYEALNPDELMWPDQYNGSAYDENIDHGEYFNTEKNFAFDLSAGISYTFIDMPVAGDKFPSKKGTFGLGFWHLNQGKRLTMTEESADIKSEFFGSFLFGLGEGNNNALNPYLLGMYAGGASEILLGLDFKLFLAQGGEYSTSKTIMTLGAAYRWEDAFISKIMYQFSNIGIGVMYEVNTSKLRNASNGFGSIEVLLSYSPARKNFSLY